MRQPEVCREDGPAKPGRARWPTCYAICTVGATTLGGKCVYTTGGATTCATNDAASATAVGPAWRAVSGDATAADANDGTAATNATRDATYDGAYATGKHDGTAAAIWRAESVRTDLLTGRGGF